MALFNFLHPKRRMRNYAAWCVFTDRRGHGDVFIIQNKALAAKFWAVLDGKLFFTHGRRKADRKQEVNHGFDMYVEFAWPEYKKPCNTCAFKNMMGGNPFCVKCFYLRTVQVAEEANHEDTM